MTTFPLSPPGRLVEVAGRQLFVREIGEGPAVVSIHGGGPGANGWNRSAQNVDALAIGFRLVLPDMPGFGKSDPPPPGSARGPAGWVRQLEGLLDDMELDRFHLIGHANGGLAAMALAIDHPGRVRSLILTAPFAGNERDIPGLTDGIRALDRLRAEPNVDTMRAYLETLVFDPSRLSDSLVSERLLSWDEQRARATQEVAAAVTDQAPDRSAELSRIECDTLLIFGANDRHIPPATAFALVEAIPRSQLHVLRHCGHWADFECPDDFNWLATSFWQRPARGGNA